MNRKENLKKLLRITEHPWSSDDDDDTTMAAVVDSTSRSLNTESEPATTRANGSTQSEPQVLSPVRRNQTRLERDLFWSLINNPHRMPVVDPACPGPSSFDPVETREQIDLDSPLSNIRRIFAINKLSRKMNLARSRNRNRPNFLPEPHRFMKFGRSRNRSLSGCQHSHANTNDRISAPASVDIPPGEINLNRAVASGQESEPNNSPSEDEFIDLDDSFQEPVSLSNAAGEDNVDHGHVPVELPSEQAVPEEVVVEIDPDIEVIDAPEAGGETLPQANTSAQSNEEPGAANESEAPPDRQGVKRKRDDHDDINTVKEFNQSMLRLLECPVCMECMEPPMTQCRRGHLVCGPCRVRLNACPVCRTAFSSVRNRAMEAVAELLRYPCRYGCGREARLRRRPAHEASCTARRYVCPVPPCTECAPFPLADLPYHFQTRHLSILKVGRKHRFSMQVNAEKHDNWLVMAVRELFHLRVDVDVRTWGFVVYVAYIGPRCNAKNFTYEVTITGQHNNRKLVYTRATHSDLESSTLNVSRQDCFHLTLDQALNFLRLKNRHCEPDKYLDFVVEINKRDAPPISRESTDS